ncbi:hypothetical protein ACFL3X_00745 [Gemmatimonadota bacterium]
MNSGEGKVLFEPCDVFLTRSRSLLGRAIRLATRGFGESRSMVNHVGIIVAAGSAEETVGVEALRTVKRHSLLQQYGPGSSSDIAVYRPINLTEEEKVVIVSAAEEYVGRSYGYLKIAAHLLDWLLFGVYFFRRLARVDDYPICSWLVAHAFAKADKTFGVQPGKASPDDIWDFVTKYPDRYEEIYTLGPMRRSADPAATQGTERLI